MNVLSVFDGMSCARLALQKARIAVKRYYASEIDKAAIKVTQNNFPDTIQIGDVTAVGAAKLKKIDLFLGGSPCQGFSRAGDLLNFKDPRSKLFFEYVRILDEIRHKNKSVKFLLENVNMRKEWRDIITEILEVEPILINSALVSAQNRRRLYWTNIPFIGQPKERGIVLDDIIDHTRPVKYLSPIALTGMERRKKKYLARGAGHGHVIADLNGKSGTLLARYYKDGREILIDDGHGIRMLTPVECERLQTLPDNYTAGVSNTQRYKMIGNGWNVATITHILKGLKL